MAEKRKYASGYAKRLAKKRKEEKEGMGRRSIFDFVCISLRLFCTLAVTVAEAERSFSKLKLVKNSLRSSMGQERLQALLSIEHKLAKTVDFSDIIHDFAQKKLEK